MKLLFRQCVPEDLPILQQFSRNTYYETFAHLNKPSVMDAYLEHAFAPDKLREELANAGSDFYFLYTDGDLSGYIKLNEGRAQTDFFDPNALEIERIYVKSDFHGKGQGSILMNKATDIAAMRDKAFVWLGVWEKNERAIAFYKKHGFYIGGTHSFFMGGEEQRDYVMRRDLKPS
jgi:ribosomal protein S18 acetylase RimI-like enzyme